MNFKKLLLTLILCATSLVPLNVFADNDDQAPQDPLIHINYNDAFDQSSIHQRYRRLLTQLGCAQNVFASTQPTTNTISTALTPADAIVIDMRSFEDEEQEFGAVSNSSDFTINKEIQHNLECYERDCLRKLRSARRSSIFHEGREALISMGLLGCATGTLNTVLPSNSLGGSFGIFAAIFDSIHLLKPLSRSIYNLIFLPAHQLNELENRFAKTQCFIPRELWPIIIEKFMIARTNPFEQRTSMEFIKFALGLTIYKPLPALQTNRTTISLNIQKLFRKIDQFFNQYNDQPPQNLWSLKNNILIFIRALLGDQAQAPSYIYLHGIGGIGKTHFVNLLSQWIEELIPIQFENSVVLTAEELEGSSDRAGVMLRVLCNQLMQNKRGSVVFMDDATWLNDASMISAAKRVFNGDQSKLSTSYFGGGIDGSGINLKIPPMLIFVASNDEIHDTALKTRFDTIEFPTPKKERLVEYAHEIASKSELIQNNNINLSTFNFTQWIEQSKINNFRDAKLQIVPYILSNQH